MNTRPFDRESKRQLLIESAAKVFAEQGFAGTRVADVAERAQVAKGTVYEYFSSKDELFFAVFEFINRLIWNRVEMVRAAHETARDQLVALFRLGGELVVQQRDIYPVMNLDLWVNSRGGSLQQEFTEAVDQQYREYRGLAADIIRWGQDRGEFRQDVDADGIATLLVSTFDGLGLQYWLDRTIDPEKSSNEFALALCRGLCLEEE
jgi:AcrR family transcriptional regulator